MNQVSHEFVSPQQLRIGMFIELEVGWMAHPFPTGSFKITSEKQIETIRGLGLTRIRHIPDKSDLMPVSAALPDAFSDQSASAPAHDVQLRLQAEAEDQRQRILRVQLIEAQHRSLMVCERGFADSVRHYKKTVEQVKSQPKAAMAQCLSMVNGVIDQILAEGESAIRLLSDGLGDRASMHPVNVTILSLLLGQAMRLPQASMLDLGVAAFLHDIGKLEVPDRVRWFDENFSIAEYKLYQEHVAQGIILSKHMGASTGAMLGIAQHHELVDGSGFPDRLKGDDMTVVSKIVALVNRYENLCNPSRPGAAITPHEALALIFAQMKSRFDTAVLSSFIRMMGVYPPGSVVQLLDERFAMVISVNSSRPLKPKLIVFDPAISRHEALILDLELAPMMGIRRSLKPSSLPKAALDYLSPRQRLCYFFEKAVDSERGEPQA
jgi:HD-GYP domain-containing protein (c-di-GMP phosphodiesterase class II)